MDGQTRQSRSKIGLSLFILIPWILSGCFGVDPNRTDQSDTSPRMIVKFRTPQAHSSFFAAPAQAVLQSVVGHSGSVEQIVDSTYVVSGAGIDSLRASDDVEYFEPDPIAYALHSPNDPLYSSQWAHVKVESGRAWDLSKGTRNVLVAVIDTGIDYHHPDLVPNLWTDPQDGSHGRNFINNSPDPMADDSPTFHGTHVSGIIGAAGDNGTGVIGHSPRVSLLALKFLGANGSGNVSHAIQAIYYAVSRGAKIISNSWGSPQYSQALGEAIEQARQAGALFVAAAGNGGRDGIGDNNDQVGNYPSNYPIDNVLAVAATDPSDQLTRFSNYGPKSVHVAAPGENINSTSNNSSYQNLSGTSMATPLVSGVAALLMSVRPELTYSEIKRILIDTSDPIPSLQGRVVSNGRINAYRALASITQTPVPTPTPPRPTPPGPVPVPPPDENARPPLLSGNTHLALSNPMTEIQLSYDVSEFGSATAAYLEISRPNMPFSTSNGNHPDPFRLNYIFFPLTRGAVTLIPVRDLPGWGHYSFRVIPLVLTTAGYRAAGNFSSSSQLGLFP